MDGVGNADEVGGATGRARLPFDYPVPAGATVGIAFLVSAVALK